MKRFLLISLNPRLTRVVRTFLLLPALLAPAKGSAAEASNFTVPPGLQLAPGLSATVWAADPLVQNPVAISIDDRGRCYTAETHRWSQSIFDITRQPTWLLEDLSFRTVSDRSNFLSKTFSTNFHQLTKDSERVTWVEDRSGRGRAEVGGVLATGFQNSTAGTAAGVLATGDDVWFACIPDLVKLGSSSASGEADRREVVHTGFGVHVGVSGHDLHGLKMGPDGRVYFSIGDRGFSMPESARRGAPRAGWNFPLQQPDSGAILRCEPDGSQLEVVAIGVRNPQELTFDDQGNLWTGDNDTAGADDSRLLYIVEGGDYGWRCSYQHQTGFGPWVQESLWHGGREDILPTCGVVSQGPCGLDYYPGTGLGEGFRGHFLMCDFPGGIWDFTVTRAGAGFKLGTRQKFAWGLWPTDVEFGPDGGVYVADWVFGWEKPDKGRIYRLADSKFVSEPAAIQTRDLLKNGLASGTPSTWETLLAHGDQRVRLRAQWKLATAAAEGLPHFRNALKSSSSPLARIHSLWGLGQVGRKSIPPALSAEVHALILQSLHDIDSEVRAQAARICGDLAIPSAVEVLTKALVDADSRVRFFAAISLGRLGPNRNLDPVLAMLRDNADQDPYLRHAGVMALLGMADTAGLIRVSKNESSAVRQAALVAMRRLGMAEVAGLLSDTDPGLITAAARAINDVPITAALPQLAAFLGKVDCPTQLVSRAINANLRVGADRNATVLASYAVRRDVSDPFRVMALEALGEWANPSPLDRVMGLWRPIKTRNAEPARRALRTAAPALFQVKPEAVAQAALKAAVSLGVKEIGHGAADLFARSNASPGLRMEILRTLAGLRHSRWPELLQTGLKDSDPAVRAEALRLAADDPRGDIHESVVALLADGNPLSVRQTALAVLSRLNDPRADVLLLDWVKQLAAGKSQPELALDILEAASSRSDAGLKAALAPLPGLPSKSAFPEDFQAVLSGGDAARGRKIFFDRADVSCVRCHKIAGNGGPVGPALDGLGKRATRPEILESILRPNARIATGFEQAVIRTKGGASHTGVVKSESDKELVLENLEDGIVTLPKRDIESRTRASSAMPEGFESMLSRRELRDLVEFLTQQK